MIDCTVTGSRRYSADLPQGGMEIPCILTFKSSSRKECDKAVKLLNMTLSKVDDGCDKADTMSEISNITCNQLQINSEVQSAKP